MSKAYPRIENDEDCKYVFLLHMGDKLVFKRKDSFVKHRHTFAVFQ